MSCEEFVAALSAGARPSQAFVAHAERCTGCARLWDTEAQLRGVGTSAPAPAPGAALGRLFVTRHGATRATHPVRRILAVLAAAATCIALALAWVPRADLAAAPSALLVLPFAAFALLWIAGVQLYAYRGRSGLGVSPRLRWAFALAAVAVFEGLVALEAAQSAPWSAGRGIARIAASHDCLVLGLAVAGFVGAIAFAVARRTVLIGAAASGALAGSLAGLAAVMFLHLHCAASQPAHLAIVHALPLVCAITAGAFTGRRILAA